MRAVVLQELANPPLAGQQRRGCFGVCLVALLSEPLLLRVELRSRGRGMVRPVKFMGPAMEAY